MLAIWRAEQICQSIQFHSTPAMACRNPGPQPCRIPQQKHSRKTKVDTKQFELFVDFVYDVDVVFWFHGISFFQMFPDVQFLLWKIKIHAKRLRLAASCSRRALPPSVLLVSYVPYVPCGEISWDFPDQPIWNIIWDIIIYYHLLFGIWCPTDSKWNIYDIQYIWNITVYI